MELDKKKLVEKLSKALDKDWERKVERDEVSFLKYLIDSCEHVLENEEIMSTVQIVDPLFRQLILLRIGGSRRLERVYSIKYGKYAEGTDLLRRR